MVARHPRRAAAGLLWALIGCSTTTVSPADPTACADLSWFIGTWSNADGSSTERWSRDASEQLVGESITRSNGEVVYTEALRIVQGSKGAEYQASPQGQPPNTFALEACGDRWAKFTDEAHDWPQSITYRREGERMTATVEGTDDGKPRTETWRWTRASEAGA